MILTSESNELPPALYIYKDTIYLNARDLLSADGILDEEMLEIPVKFSNKKKAEVFRKNVTVLTNVQSFDVDNLKVASFIDEDELFKYELKDNFELFYAFIKEIRENFEMRVGSGRFIPTLTGGLDTRVLLHFWLPYLSKIDYFYLKSTKQDGKNNVERGSKEVEIAKKIFKSLGRENITQIESLLGYGTASGIFTEGGRKKETLNNKDWILTYPPVSSSYFTSFGSFNPGFHPFLFKEYLMLKHPEANFMRTLLYVLFVQPYQHSKIEFAGFADHDLYSYEEAFAEQIAKVNELLDYWGPEKVQILRSC